MQYSSLLAIVLAALAAAGNTTISRRSLLSLPFTKTINNTGIPNIVKYEQARLKAFKDGTYGIPTDSTGSTPSVSIPATDAGIVYSAPVGIGTPPTYYNLIVDTGSSNTWAGANPDSPYVVTSSTVDTGYYLLIAYGTGFLLSYEYNDTVTLGSIALLNQGVGAKILSSDFEGQDGILGIGPLDLTLGKIPACQECTVPTVVDTAFDQGFISARSVAISFEPTDTAPVTNGEVTFGGVDPTKYYPDIVYTPVTDTPPSSQYWGINQSIAYNGQTILSTTAGVVDSGNTLLWLATDAYTAYQNLTGATEVFNEDTEVYWLTVTEDQYNNLADLVFTIGGKDFALTPNAQIWPRNLNWAINGSDDVIYLIAQNTEAESGSGLDFVNGQSFLERFYSVFDTTNNQVGFAETPLTRAIIN
ncbi:hypothetical protein NM688_g2458 [Phlebia brevispora]|uniref:Uncharacterized protein n=1 Tax=Phlebia brevispora TaxID=194682 RepID=A0ACC1T8S8_9APHY|nr:hypothetical protein NM688_g2458 [Phlebia brevispora]